MVSNKEARDILEVRARLEEKVPGDKWAGLVADIVQGDDGIDTDYSFYDESDYDTVYPGEPGYEEALAAQEGSEPQAKESPFRPDVKELISGIISELEMKGSTRAAPHVRTAAGVLKFRQSINARITRDLVPSTLDAPKVGGVIDATPEYDTLGAGSVLLSKHVQMRAKDASTRRKGADEDAALKMDANAALHPTIKEKLHATKAGREWLAKNSTANPDMLKSIIKECFGYTSKEVGNSGFVRDIRKGLISLDPKASTRTDAENNALADRMAVYIMSGDMYVTDSLDENYGGIQYSRRMIQALNIRGKEVRGENTDDVFYKNHLNANDEDLIRRFYAKIEESNPEDTVIAEWTRKCIDTWADTSFDHNSLSIAMQATAETLYGGDSNVTRFPHIKATDSPGDAPLAKKVDTLITDHAPILAAFVTSVYEQTQASLKEMKVDHIRLYRGMQIDESLVKKVGNAEDSKGEIGRVVLQPLSACATSQVEAMNFTHTYGSGTSINAVPMLFTMDVPIERIWSIPTHGPGCLGEAEVIIFGGEYTAKVERNPGHSGYGGGGMMPKKKFIGKKLVKKAAKKMPPKKPMYAMVEDLPDPWGKMTYDEMVLALYEANTKYTYASSKNGSSKYSDTITLYNLAKKFDDNDIKPKTKIDKKFVQKMKDAKWDWYEDGFYPDFDYGPSDEYTPPKTLVTQMRARGLVWSDAQQGFQVPWKPSMKKMLPPEMLKKPKVKKPAAKKTPTKKMAVASKAQKLFDLGLDTHGKPKALNQSYGWHKQPDGSYKTSFAPPSLSLVEAMKMHKWTLHGAGTQSAFYPPGKSPDKKAAEKIAAKKVAKKIAVKKATKAASSAVGKTFTNATVTLTYETVKNVVWIENTTDDIATLHLSNGTAQNVWKHAIKNVVETGPKKAVHKKLLPLSKKAVKK